MSARSAVRTAGALLVAVVVAAGCGGDEGAGGGEEPGAAGAGEEAMGPASVTIEAPADGATVAGDSVPVTLSASGVEITPATVRRPGTGHHHLFLDTEATPAGDTIPDGTPGIIHLGRGQTAFTFTGVEAGEHRLIALVADADHVPLEPRVADTVRFTVAP